MSNGPTLLIHKRVRSYQTLQCANKQCGSKSLYYYRENGFYKAWKCRSCGHFVVEGDQGKFVDDENKIMYAKLEREASRLGVHPQQLLEDGWEHRI